MYALMSPLVLLQPIATAFDAMKLLSTSALLSSSLPTAYLGMMPSTVATLVAILCMTSLLLMFMPLLFISAQR